MTGGQPDEVTQCRERTATNPLPPRPMLVGSCSPYGYGWTPSAPPSGRHADMPVQHEVLSAVEQAACRLSATPCAACQKRAGTLITSGTVHSYGSEPRNGWVPRRLTDDPADATRPTFGVELETQRLRPSDRLHITADEAAACAAPRGFWHPAQDGSVDGPEFASQPGTLAYWRSVSGPVGSFFKTLVHGGMRSHDGTMSCSMHVNIGRDAFSDAAHLARFVRLVSVNMRWSVRLAQRTHSQAAQWANASMYPGMAECEAHAAAFMRNGTSWTGHGAVVNLENTGRVEFRLPRGTLRLDRFYAKLEWVASMVEFTRDPANRPVPGAFTPWVLARRAEFPEFVAMLGDLMPSRVAPRAGATCTSRSATSRERCVLPAEHPSPFCESATSLTWRRAVRITVEQPVAVAPDPGLTADEQAALGLDCEACDASAGSPCMRVDGREPRTRPHTSRVWQASEARRIAEAEAARVGAATTTCQAVNGTARCHRNPGHFGPHEGRDLTTRWYA